MFQTEISQTIPVGTTVSVRHSLMKLMGTIREHNSATGEVRVAFFNGDIWHGYDFQLQYHTEGE